jgi:uncharacterized RDD family membrane protein YckC
MTEEPTGAPPPPLDPAPAPAPSTGWAAPPPVTTPGIPGFVFADVPNRFIALIIDGIILFVISAVVGLVISSVLGPPYDIDVAEGTFEVTVTTNWVSAIVTLLVNLAVSAVYWIYTWTKMRGSPGMKILGMQVGNYPDGATLTQNQAIRRWVALGGLLPLVQTLNQLPLIGVLIGIGTFAYFAFLLYTTAKSPTKQGFHDKYANSVVVKAARVA